MALPQTRMYESMRDVDSLNRAMNSAKEAVDRKQTNEQGRGASYLRLLLMLGPPGVVRSPPQASRFKVREVDLVAC